MAENKKSKVEEREVVVSSVVESTTEATPSEADKSSAPGPYNPEAGGPSLNDPPVRTNRPDVPIAHALVAGAGQHTPPDSSEVGPDGRAVYDEVAASEAGEGETVSADEADAQAVARDRGERAAGPASGANK